MSCSIDVLSSDTGLDDGTHPEGQDSFAIEDRQGSLRHSLVPSFSLLPILFRLLL